MQEEVSKLLLIEHSSDIFFGKDVLLTKKGIPGKESDKGVSFFASYLKKGELSKATVKLNIESEALLFCIFFKKNINQYFMKINSEDEFPKPIMLKKVREIEYVKLPTYVKIDSFLVNLIKDITGVIHVNVYDSATKTNE